MRKRGEVGEGAILPRWDSDRLGLAGVFRMMIQETLRGERENHTRRQRESLSHELDSVGLEDMLVAGSSTTFSL